ncbi:MAG: ABC transporter permease [Candidatus Izemoplasmatales bacterium]
MNNFFRLLKGEFLRLVKYRIVLFGLIVSAIWVLILALSAKAEAEMLFPYLVTMDTGMMSIVLLGASYYFERQEGTLKTLLVAPVTVTEVLAAKVFAAILTGILSSVVIMLAGWIVHGMTVNVLGILFYTILAVFAHTALGFVLALASKDFMSFLLRYMGLVILFVVPMFLVPLGLLEGGWRYLGMLSPMYATEVLIGSLFETAETAELVVSAVWLFVLGGTVYPFIVYRRFRAKAIEG